ncbi:MAG: DMT family transporter [Alphaproteobacteria bacterium]|nr:DMT family transporter [Alphaproteobacteria bacterium]
MTQQQSGMNPTEWGLLLLLSAIWGGSFYFFAILIKELPVFTIVFLRVFLATLALWVVVLLSGLKAPDSLSKWKDYFIMCLLNNVVPFSLIVWGESRVAPGLGAVLNATTPFFTVLVAHAFTTNERLSWNRLTGALVGLFGVAAMMGLDAVKTMGSDIYYQLAFVLASVCYGLSSVWARRFSATPPLVNAASQTAASSLMLLPLMLIFDHPWALPMPSNLAIFSQLGLSLLCTAVAYILFFTIVKRAGSTNISLVTFLVPISAIILGAALLNEQIGINHILGMLVIGVGLALIDGRIPAKLIAATRG